MVFEFDDELIKKIHIQHQYKCTFDIKLTTFARVNFFLDDSTCSNVENCVNSVAVDMMIDKMLRCQVLH